MNYSKKLIFSILFGLSIFPAAAMAQTRSGSGGNFYIDLSLFPDYVYRNDTGSVDSSGGPNVATESGLGYDIRTTFGYIFNDQFLFGLSYNSYSLTTKRDNVSGGDSGLDETTKRSEYGPTIGYVGNNVRVLFTSFISGKKQRDTVNSDDTGTIGDVSITNTDMSGYQLSVGYIFNLSSNFQLGPSLVYRNVKYTTQSKVNRLNSIEDYDGVKLNSPAVDGSLLPMISLVFRF